MSLLKTLIGSIVGAAIATAIYFVVKSYVFEPDQGKDLLVWFPIVTGILTGLLARSFGGPLLANSSRVLVGATAAFIAAAAMFGHEIGPPLINAWTVDVSPIRPGEVTARPRANASPSESSPDAVAEVVETDDSNATEEGDAAVSEEAPEDRPRKPPALVGVSMEGDVERGGGDDLREVMPGRGSLPTGPIGGGDSRATIETLTTIAESTEPPPTKFQQYLPYVVYAIGVLLAFQITVTGRKTK